MTLGFAARFDRKRVLVVLLMLLVVFNSIIATAHGFAALMFGRVLLGIAVGGFWTIGGSLGPRLRPGAEGPRATVQTFSGVSLGTVAGVPAATSQDRPHGSPAHLRRAVRGLYLHYSLPPRCNRDLIRAHSAWCRSAMARRCSPETCSGAGLLAGTSFLPFPAPLF
ncbi:MFS transporter [Agrobacterium tumefaciens]|uniref:MFS transporter n=1 Tax=Agrobacterium TaxID=357 RepID=UPI001C6E3E2B|nr:MFS transporter [Agrobacterium tumefaciens]MBW9075075.1 MFS transporter [Agrobacterium deltaense]UNZ54087.1 MFS transporter [Agrobacterium tumefaciens]